MHVTNEMIEHTPKKIFFPLGRGVRMEFFVLCSHMFPMMFLKFSLCSQQHLAPSHTFCPKFSLSRDVASSAMPRQMDVVQGFSSIQRIVLHVIFLLMVLCILSWRLCQMAFLVLCVVRRKGRLPCCCVINANVVGIWHV